MRPKKNSELATPLHVLPAQCPLLIQNRATLYSTRPPSPIPYPLSPIPCHLSPAPYPLSPIPCLLSYVPYPLFPILYPLSSIPYTLPPILYSLSPVSCPLSPIPCPLSPILYPLPPVPCPYPLSPILYYLSPVPYPLSPTPCPLSSIICPMSPIPCPLPFCPLFPVRLKAVDASIRAGLWGLALLIAAQCPTLAVAAEGSEGGDAPPPQPTYQRVVRLYANAFLYSGTPLHTMALAFSGQAGAAIKHGGKSLGGGCGGGAGARAGDGAASAGQGGFEESWMATAAAIVSNKVLQAWHMGIF